MFHWLYQLTADSVQNCNIFSAIFLNHAKKCPWLNPNMQTKVDTFNELYVLIIKFANHICPTKQTNHVKTCQILSYHVVSGHNRQKIAQLTLHCWLEGVIKEFSGFKACFFSFFLTDVTYFFSFSGPQLYNSEALIFISMLL